MLRKTKKIRELVDRQSSVLRVKTNENETEHNTIKLIVYNVCSCHTWKGNKEFEKFPGTNICDAQISSDIMISITSRALRALQQP